MDVRLSFSLPVEFTQIFKFKDHRGSLEFQTSHQLSAICDLPEVIWRSDKKVTHVLRILSQKSEDAGFFGWLSKLDDGRIGDYKLQNVIVSVL